jgi:hypothetical protein
MMGIDLQKLRDHLENMTPEEVDKYFPKDTKPKGWLSIEDYLPAWMCEDVSQGYTEYKVRYNDGGEGISRVTDHNTWYHFAKESGITHWLNI